jgi:membrane-associated phospholipid phosphatase
VPSLRVRANALDLALYRRVRGVARTPASVRLVRSYSRLGEHGAVWLATGAAGMAVDARGAARWSRATVVRRRGVLTSTSIKLASAAAAGRRGPAAPDGDADRPLLPVVARHVVVRRRARVRRAAAARAAATRAAVAMGVSRLYLGVHYPSDVAAGAALGTAIGSSADDEGRASSACPTRASRRCSTRSRARARRRRTTRSRRSSRTSPSCPCATSGSTRSRATVGASNIVPDTIEFHDIAGLVAGAHKGEGSATSSWPTSARPTRCCTSCARTTTTNVIHPEGRVDPARDIETIETELIYADLEQAERRHAASCATRARRPRGVAEEAWLRAGDRRRCSAASRAHACPCPRTRPTRCATSRR